MPPRKKPAKPIIETTADIKRGCRQLRKLCPNLKAIHKQIGDPPLRRHTAGFPGLARIVVGQQLSIASAGAIWKRLETTTQPFSPDTFLNHNDETLRSVGLSRGKTKTLRGIAMAASEGTLNFSQLETASIDEIHEHLTALPGIGPWTADIYCLFCIGTQDAFAPGDLALQEAARIALKTESRPSQNELVELAERWRPWRGVAARLLWAYYATKPHRAE
ncbi:MAG: DNA-3-methyladenine glycosylase 2 family protein [Filomicrobium sp.]